MNIGIVGTGVVGRALEEYYKARFDVWTYDKAKNAHGNLDDLNKNAEVVMVCVGTPWSEELEALDCSQVLAAVDALTGEKTVIIKSTVMPGTTDAVQEKHSEHRVLFVPEFLSEDTAAEDYANPRRPHIIGVPPAIANENMWNYWNPAVVLPAFTIYTSRGVYTAGARVLPAKQAELLKLATNTMYTAKVILANLFHDCGMTQETLDAIAQDPWIGNSHFQIQHKNSRGAGGPCLVKDSKALAGIAQSHWLFEMLVYNQSLLDNCGKS